MCRILFIFFYKIFWFSLRIYNYRFILNLYRLFILKFIPLRFLTFRFYILISMKIYKFHFLILCSNRLMLEIKFKIFFIYMRFPSLEFILKFMLKISRLNNFYRLLLNYLLLLFNVLSLYLIIILILVL